MRIMSYFDFKRSGEFAGGDDKTSNRQLCRIGWKWIHLQGVCGLRSTEKNTYTFAHKQADLEGCCKINASLCCYSKFSFSEYELPVTVQTVQRTDTNCLVFSDREESELLSNNAAVSVQLYNNAPIGCARSHTHTLIITLSADKWTQCTRQVIFNRQRWNTQNIYNVWAFSFHQ